jgi:predicted NBD/HSP70 family sugar kinase
MTIIAGIDIGGTRIRAAAVGQNGDPMVATSLPTDARSAAGVYRSATRVLQALAVELDGTRFEALGVGIPGIVDHRAGTVTHAVNLGIGAVPLAIGCLLEEEFGVHVSVENDVNAAALGAFMHYTAREDVSDLAYLSIGTGIAAGIVLDGRLHRGANGAAGEIGHLPVASDGPRCECGLRGCLEAVASGGAFERAWPPRDGAMSALSLLNAASTGNPAAQSLVEGFSDHLARAVHLLAVVHDPERIVIGGGVAQVGDLLLDAIFAGIERLMAQSEFVRALDLCDRVRLSPPGPIGAIGAAAVARRVRDKAGSEV